jgi:hypothetical protein
MGIFWKSLEQFSTVSNMEDDLNGRQHQWQRTSMKDDLNER